MTLVDWMFAEGSGVLDQRRQKLGGLKSILFPSEHGTYKLSWFSYYSVRQKDVEMYRTSSAQAPSARHPPLMPTIGDCMRKTSFFQGSIPSRFRSFSCKTTLIHGDCPALNQHLYARTYSLHQLPWWISDRVWPPCSFGTRRTKPGRLPTAPPGRPGCHPCHWMENSWHRQPDDTGLNRWTKHLVI